MSVFELVSRYESGAITGNELVVDCLSIVDPKDAPAVLRWLPIEVLPRLREFVEQYRQGEMLANFGLIPGPEQVLAAEHWLTNGDV